MLDGVDKLSRHQADPSEAMDLLPYPSVLHGKSIWEDKIRFALFVGIVLGHAQTMGIPLRVGMDWNGDGSALDHRLVDFPHFELLV